MENNSVNLDKLANILHGKLQVKLLIKNII
jgi:hypothetical protein